MTDTELIAQWKRCEEWNDPEQWFALGLQYEARGYLLNAAACYRKAGAG